MSEFAFCYKYHEENQLEMEWVYYILQVTVHEGKLWHALGAGTQNQERTMEKDHLLVWSSCHVQSAFLCKVEPPTQG